MQANILKWPFFGLLMICSSCSYFKKEKIAEFSEPLIQIQAEEQEIEEAYWQAKKGEVDGCLILDMEEFQKNLEGLLFTHGVLFNNFVMTILNGASSEEIENETVNLLENAQGIASLFVPIYGPRIAGRFECLFSQHIKLGLAMIDAIQVDDRSYARYIALQASNNGEMLIEFLNIINPFFAYEPERRMFEEHLMLEETQARAYFSGDYETAEELKDRFLNQLKEMGAHLTEAIFAQMEDRCEPNLADEECDPPEGVDEISLGSF